MYLLSCVQIAITKAPGDILGLAVVESGWGSILPTVVVANLLHGGPAERCGELSIGDRIMSVNGTSLVGLPISTCQNIIRVRNGDTGPKFREKVLLFFFFCCLTKASILHVLNQSGL